MYSIKILEKIKIRKADMKREWEFHLISIFSLHKILSNVISLNKKLDIKLSHSPPWMEKKWRNKAFIHIEISTILANKEVIRDNNFGAFIYFYLKKGGGGGGIIRTTTECDVQSNQITNLKKISSHFIWSIYSKYIHKCQNLLKRYMSERHFGERDFSKCVVNMKQKLIVKLWDKN